MALSAAWQGRLPLGKVFWLYGVLLSTLVTLLYVWLALREDGGSSLRQFLVLAFVPYTAWILVSIWRCAPNARRPYYGDMARALTVAWAINAALLIVFVEMDRWV